MREVEIRACEAREAREIFEQTDRHMLIGGRDRIAQYVSNAQAWMIQQRCC